MQTGVPRASQNARPQVTHNLPEKRQTGTPVIVSQETFTRDPVNGNLIQQVAPQNVVLRQERPIYESKSQEVQFEITREVPKMIEKIVEYPVEITVEKPVEQRVTVDVIHEKVVDIPIEVINEVVTEQIFLHPVEMIREKIVYTDRIVEKPIVQEVRVPKEVITTRDVPVIVEVPTEVERTVFQPIESQVVKRVEVRKTPVYEVQDVVREVQVSQDKFVDVQVPRYVDQVVEVEQLVELPGRRVRREVPQAKDTVVTKTVHREVEVPVDVLVSSDGRRMEIGRRDPSGRYPGLSVDRSRSIGNQRLSGATTLRQQPPEFNRVNSVSSLQAGQVIPQRTSNHHQNSTILQNVSSNPNATVTYQFGPNGGLIPAQSLLDSGRNFQPMNPNNITSGQLPSFEQNRGNSVTISQTRPHATQILSSPQQLAQPSSNLYPSAGSYGFSSMMAPQATYHTNFQQNPSLQIGQLQPIPQRVSETRFISNQTQPQPVPQRLSGTSNAIVITSNPNTQLQQHPHTYSSSRLPYTTVPLQDARFTKESNPSTLRFTQETNNNNLRFTNLDQSSPQHPGARDTGSRHSTPGPVAQPTYSVGLSDQGSNVPRSTQEVNRNLFSAGQHTSAGAGGLNTLNNSSSGDNIRELVPSAQRNQHASQGNLGLEPIQEVRNDSMQSSSMNGGYELGHDINTPPERPVGQRQTEPLSQPRFYVSEPRAGVTSSVGVHSQANIHQTQTLRPSAATNRVDNVPQQSTSRSGSVTRRIVSEQPNFPPGYRQGEPFVSFYRDKVIPKYVEQIIEKYRDVPVERRVEVPYETIRERVITNDIIKETPFDVIRPVPGPVQEEIVEKEVEVIKVVEKPIYINKKVQRIKEIIVDKEVEVPHEIFVEKIIEKEVELDVPISTTTQRHSTVDRPIDVTTRRRTRTSVVNERLRQNLRESVERSNSASKQNAELHSKVNLIRERNNSVSGQGQTHREDRNRNQYESLKQTYESLTDRLSQLVTVDQQSRMTHQHGSS